MTIAQIRAIIRTANWSRNDSTGGTREENRRRDLPAVLLPHAAALEALQIPARFAQDAEDRSHAIYAIGIALARWQANQKCIEFRRVA